MNDTSSSVNVLEPSVSAAQPATPRVQAVPPTRAAALLAWLGRVSPTLLVFVALGGLAYWGHRTGWTLPKFSALTGNGPAAQDDWCAEHSVPESQCVECNPDLLPKKTFGWCETHGVHDCPWEHPAVAQLAKTPPITPADLERARQALAIAERPQNNEGCQLHARRIQFASRESLNKQGIDLEQVKRKRIEESITANGGIGYDAYQVASLSTPVPGKLWRMDKEIGQSVKNDEVLALVDAAEVGKAKGEFRQALVQVDLWSKKVETLRGLLARGSTSDASVREAEATLQETQNRLVSAEQALLNLGLPVRREDLKGLPLEELRKRLQFIGLPESVVKTLPAQTMTDNLVPIKAPFDGVVIARKGVKDEWVDPAKTLFTVADTRQMWLTLHVRLEDAKYLALGQPVRFRPDGSKEEAAGKVSWISTAVDEKTRTVEVRADLANPAGRLRANAFGTGTVVLREEPQAIVVPNEAIHWEGNCHVVFVYDKNSLKGDAPQVFYVRSVRPGAKDDKHTEIIAGLLLGERVAAKNSGVLRAELLKNNLGAG